MKKAFLIVLGFMLVASCADTDTPTKPDEPNNKREIKLSARLKTFVTKADDGTSQFQENKDDVFSVFAIKLTPSGGSEDPTETLYFSPIHIDSKENSELVFHQTKYYPFDDSQYLHFYAFAPSVDAAHFTADDKSQYVLDGSQDVMWAKDVHDFKVTSSDDPTFNLHHKLMKITFAVKADDDFPTDPAVPVTSIIINDVKTNLTLNDLDGSMTWGDDVVDVNAYSESTNIGSEITEIPGTILMQPLDVIHITVVAGDVTYSNHEVTLPALSQGQTREGIAHRVVLTFYSKDIAVDAVVTNWETGDDAATDMKL